MWAGRRAAACRPPSWRRPGPPRRPPCSKANRATTRPLRARRGRQRSEEHTSELQSLMRISYAVFCLKKKNQKTKQRKKSTQQYNKKKKTNNIDKNQRVE